MKESEKQSIRYALLLPPVLTLILELLPFGAVCVFAPGPGERVRATFSYFSLTPFGYANFAPLITAMLTVLLLAALIAAVVGKGAGKHRFALLLALTAAVVSLLPLLYGIEYYSLTGAGISFFLVGESTLLLCPHSCKNTQS